MAEGEGLLGEQLSAAVQIPYKNIQSNQTSLEMGLNAWSTASQIKLKRQELEGKMASLVARNRQLEINDDLKEKMFNMRMEGMAQGHAIAEQRLMLEAEKNRGGADIAYQKLDLARDKFDQFHDREMARNDAQAGLEHLETELAAEGKKRGDPGWDDEYMKRADERGFFKALAPSEWSKVHADVATGQNAAVKLRQTIIDSKIDSWKRDFGSDIYGTPGKTDTSILEDPRSLPDATKKVDSPIFGHYWKTTVPDPDKKLVTGYDAATGKAVPNKPVSLKELLKRSQEWKDLMEEKQGTAKPKDYPDLNIYKDETSVPVPANPAQREDNKIYTLPKGRFRWNASTRQWETP